MNILKIKNLSFYYNEGQDILNDVSFEVTSGERLGIVGPSGFGKSTLAQIIAGFEKQVKGEILYNGRPIDEITPYPVQLIYQHPEKAINPKWKLSKLEDEMDKKISSSHKKNLELKEEWFDRYPAELSGGELQRFMVARALTVDSKFIIADEISTMLDALTQAKIWKFLLDDITKEKGLIIISHNQYLIDKLCTRVIDLEELMNK